MRILAMLRQCQQYMCTFTSRAPLSIITKLQVVLRHILVWSLPGTCISPRDVSSSDIDQLPYPWDEGKARLGDFPPSWRSTGDEQPGIAEEGLRKNGISCTTHPALLPNTLLWTAGNPGAIGFVRNRSLNPCIICFVYAPESVLLATDLCQHASQPAGSSASRRSYVWKAHLERSQLIHMWNGTFFTFYRI